MVLLYTDASHGGRKRRFGAYAFVIVDAPDSSIQSDYYGNTSGPIIGYGYGHLPGCTSSTQAELIAALHGLREAGKRHRTVTLVCDNSSVVFGMRNPYKLSREGAPDMRPYWRELIPITMTVGVNGVHINGHKQQTFNTLCDWICQQIIIVNHPDMPQEAKDTAQYRLDRCVGLTNAGTAKTNAWLNSLIKTTK